MLQSLGSEFYILRQAPIEDIKRTAGPCIAEGIRRLRIGQVERKPGFDGEYGVISLLSPSEIEQLNGQISLFGADVPKKTSKQQSKIQTTAPAPEETPIINTSDRLNTEQQKAVSDLQRVVAVIAGPGTGKTKTLVSRIAYLIEEHGVKPEEITAVTFTNQAAAEMRHRLEQRLGGKRAISRMTIGTFHAICLKLLEMCALSVKARQ
ncbi:MAG: UvrD-helicase domain-containing protein [Acutalibacteraceae bacterium]